MTAPIMTHFITLRFLKYRDSYAADEADYNLEILEFIKHITILMKSKRNYDRFKKHHLNRFLLPHYDMIEYTLDRLHPRPHAHIAIQKPDRISNTDFVQAIHQCARKHLKFLKNEADAIHVTEIYDQDTLASYFVKETHPFHTSLSRAA